MDRSLKIRIGLIVAAIIACIYLVQPTWKLFRLKPEQKAAMTEAEVKALKEKSIKLGLDIQGGMYLVLEVDRSKLEPGEKMTNVVGRAETIIRNRVDKFGVAEPVIHTEGQDRIVVQLAGITDPSRAKSLVGQTALLEFNIVREGDEFRRLTSTIDSSLKPEIESLTSEEAHQNLEEELRSAAQTSDTTGLRSELEEAGIGTTLASLIQFQRVGTHEDAFVLEQDVPVVQKIFDMAQEHHLIPPDVEILWDNRNVPYETQASRVVYLVTRKPSLTGQRVTTARVQIGGDPTRPGAPSVSLDFDRAGRALFSRVTGENVGRRMAIVLDGLVHSAPNIQEKISGGRGAQITGSFTTNQAKDLSNVLEAGALPAPLMIVEERTVGPSLGSDSIRSGIRASVIGGISIFVFMVLFYNLSGLIADMALVLNLLILLAAMVVLRGTLTLPGIAGVILSLAMAVDSNVLIFERIKEELRAGKTVRKAIQDGYARAFITILDSNVTTVITAIVLYQFGTGPIRGFAVTLIVGIAASMFTAIVVTRAVYDSITSVRHLNKLYI
jgi:SecD/SecF fusion protein